jgi:hypothetical protein
MHPKSLLTLLAVGALCASSAACTDADETLLILQNQLPGEGCQIPSARTADFVPRGLIDTRGSIGYRFTPVVQSFAEVTSGTSRQQRIIVIEGANVDLSFQQDANGNSVGDGLPAAFTSFSLGFSGTIEPGGTAAFNFTILPFEVLEHLAPLLSPDGRQATQVRAEVSMFGTMSGGRVRSDPFLYWIDVCNGCLVNSVGSCATLPEDFEGELGGACNPTQDTARVDCCDAGGALVCPARQIL